MDLISKFVQSLRERPSIQGAILHSPTLFWLIHFFLGSIKSIFVCSCVQRGVYGGMCGVLMLQNHHQLINRHIIASKT